MIPGKRLGTELGFPTANLSYHIHLPHMPKDGVYIATARLEKGKRLYTALLNQGRHPTAPEGAPTIEVHLLNYAGGALYGQVLHLTYWQHLRPEQKFSSLQALQTQLAQDLTAATQWAQAHPDLLL